MRFLCTSLISFVLSLLMLIPTATAGLSPEYSAWIDSPAGFLLTKQEIKDWKDVATDAQARKFIDLFWARRNPHPEAAFNEFRAKFESMVKFCDEKFGYEGQRGSLTDRGRVFLLMGPPQQKETRAPTQTVTMAATAAGQDDRGTDQARANLEMWVYDPPQMNPKFRAKGSRVLFTFYENRPETNEFVMDRSHREATMALRLMHRAPEVYLLHPELESVPKPISVPGGRSATSEQLAAIGSADAGAQQDALRFELDLGVADAVHRPLWLHLELPASAAPVETLAGRVLASADQEVVSTFQIAATPKQEGESRSYDLTFPLGPGQYRYEVGAFNGGVLQGVLKGDIEVPVAPEGQWLSPVWLGLSAEKIEKPVLGLAYSFGAWHLFPLVASSVPHQSQLSYFGYVIRPQIEEGKAPSAALKLTLRKDGKRLGRPLKMNLPMVRVTDDVYLYANAISLAALPAGVCRLEFEVSAPGTEDTATRSVQLELVD